MDSLQLVICKRLVGILFQRNGELMKKEGLIVDMDMSRADGFIEGGTNGVC